MAFDQFALQQAIIQQLYTEFPEFMPNPSVKNDVGKILNVVPAKQAYPYIRIDMISADDDGTKTGGMWECEVQISAFFDDLGSTQPVSGLQKRIASALIDQQATLTMTGQSCVFVRQLMQTILQPGGPDERHLHGVQRFRMLVQEA